MYKSIGAIHTRKLPFAAAVALLLTTAACGGPPDAQEDPNSAALSGASGTNVSAGSAGTRTSGTKPAAAPAGLTNPRALGVPDCPNGDCGDAGPPAPRPGPSPAGIPDCPSGDCY